MNEINPTIDATTKAIVANIRSTVRSASAYADYVSAHGVTRENVKDHAAALATLAYPKDNQVQKVDGKRTRYGNAVQAAAAGLRKVLAPADSDPAATDFLALVVKAADKATDNGITLDQIIDALQSA